ncbi:hypothetical protein K488DRAFT_89934 [Vararia minispora EC-137]|uniref:Uncharacterized protein n=1 Tax=Vararia minispora EC-137 TaxID=1314806 RepID=A0ACB8Q8U3_9AGAM|nr:hypothetical protein K488DRAFT_89934 [Vararia minispora EC-137]
MLRKTIIPLSNPYGHGGKEQPFTLPVSLPDDHPHKKNEGKPKGMRLSTLEEQGYPLMNPKTGCFIPGDCQNCKARKSRKVKDPNDPNLSLNDSADEDDEYPENCCLRRMLAMQDDFRAQ